MSVPTAIDFGKVTEGGSFTGYQNCFHPDRSRPDGRATRFHMLTSAQSKL
jgi:hypothetical protein